MQAGPQTLVQNVIISADPEPKNSAYADIKIGISKDMTSISVDTTTINSRVESSISITDGIPSPHATVPFSPSIAAFIEKIIRSKSLTESLSTNVTYGVTIDASTRPVILPSQRSAIQKHFLKQKFKESQTEWKTWLEKADIDTEPDETYIANVATLDEEYNDPDEKKQNVDDQILSPIQRLTNWMKKRRKIVKRPRTAPVRYSKMSSEDQREVRLFIIDIAYAQSIYGIPAHRLENNLNVISNYYGVTGNYFCVPTGIWLNFGSILDANKDNMDGCGQPNFNFFIRVDFGTMNMSKFMALDRLALHVSSGRVPNIQEARKKVRDIVSADNVFASPLFTLFTYVAYATISPILMNGNWGEIIASLVGGLIVGLIALSRSKFEVMTRIGNTFSTLVAGLMAMLFRFAFFPIGIHIDVLMVALNSNMMNLPGLALTIALTELNAGHFMSGTMRSVAVAVRVIEFGLGLLVADRIDTALERAFKDRYLLDVMDRTPLQIWIKLLVLPIFFAIVIIAMRVPRYFSAYFFIALASLAAFLGDTYLSAIFGVEVGALINSFIIGFIGNLYSFVSKRPHNVVTTCALLFLVPGYLSAVSVSKLLEKDATRSINLLFDTIMMAVSLVGGLTVSEAIFYRRRGRMAY